MAWMNPNACHLDFGDSTWNRQRVVPSPFLPVDSSARLPWLGVTNIDWRANEGGARGGFIDMRAHAKLLSALRSDTPA
jgi:hypothetical protein